MRIVALITKNADSKAKFAQKKERKKKDSEHLKSLDIGLWEVGATRRFNGVNK